MPPKAPKAAPQALVAIDLADLDAVTGGRLQVRKGPDPEIIRGLQGLTESVGALGQKRAAEDAQQQQMTGQIMQQMMGRRG
jgi:hypothetical protein